MKLADEAYADIRGLWDEVVTLSQASQREHKRRREAVTPDITGAVDVEAELC